MTLPFTVYSAILSAIDAVGQGMTVTRACDVAGVSVAVFRRETRASPELNDLLTEATERGADAMADALVNIDNDAMFGHTNPAMAKVLSDNIKWLLSKRHAKTYGEKIEVQHYLTADKAIIDALNAARNRMALPAPDDVSDAELIDEAAELRALLS